jgi:hypothetical protein
MARAAHPEAGAGSNPDVLAVRVATEFDKETLIDMDPRVFTEPH